MAVNVTALHANPTVQVPGLNIYSGVAECSFRGIAGSVARDQLIFIITSPRVSLAVQPRQISCVVSLASFAYDGTVSDALWAVDSSSVSLVNEDRGTGTAQLQVVADIAVRGVQAIILRVNYSIYVRQ